MNLPSILLQFTPPAHPLTLQVYEELARDGYSVDYYRVPVTDEKAPKERDCDALIGRCWEPPEGAALVFNCFPEAGHQVLTQEGWMGLGSLEAARERLGSGALKIASYDPATEEIVYAPAQLIVKDSARQTLVQVMDRGEGQRWGEASDKYGNTEATKDFRSTYVALQTTPDHDMYVKLENKTTSNKVDWSPYAKVKAAALLTRAREADAGSQRVKVSLRASGGVRVDDPTPAPRHLPDGTPNPLAALLIFEWTDDQWDSFFDLVGFWMGGGTMTGGKVVCQQVRQADHAFLEAIFDALHWRLGYEVTRTGPYVTHNQKEIYRYAIEVPEVTRLFAEEWGRKYMSRDGEKYIGGGTEEPRQRAASAVPRGPLPSWVAASRDPTTPPPDDSSPVRKKFKNVDDDRLSECAPGYEELHAEAEANIEEYADIHLSLDELRGEADVEDEADTVEFEVEDEVVRIPVE